MIQTIKKGTLLWRMEIVTNQNFYLDKIQTLVQLHPLLISSVRINGFDLKRAEHLRSAGIKNASVISLYPTLPGLGCYSYIEALVKNHLDTLAPAPVIQPQNMISIMTVKELVHE